MDTEQTANSHNCPFSPKRKIPGVVRYTGKLICYNTVTEMSVVELVDELSLKMVMDFDKMERHIKDNITKKLMFAYINKNAAPALERVLMQYVDELQQMLYTSGYSLRIERED